MTLRLGQLAPDFEQDTANGSINFYRWLGDFWGVLFSHPGDHSAVSLAELAEVARLRSEWERRMVRPVGLALDTAEGCCNLEQEIGAAEGQDFNFPLVADSDGSVAELYGMVHPEVDPVAAMRCVVVIDPSKRVRLILTYPPGIGRNFKEVLRVIDGLQLADAHTGLRVRR